MVSGSGKVNVELAALSGTDDADGSVVGFDEFFGDGQAQPGASFLLARDTEESFEDVLLKRGGHPRALVDDAKAHGTIFELRDSNNDCASRR